MSGSQRDVMAKNLPSYQTQPQIVRFHSNLVQTLTRDTRCATNVQGQRMKGQGHSVTTYQRHKRCKSGTDRLTRVQFGANYLSVAQHATDVQRH